jgi:hypothetical protein
VTKCQRNPRHISASGNLLLQGRKELATSKCCRPAERTQGHKRNLHMAQYVVTHNIHHAICFAARLATQLCSDAATGADLGGNQTVAIVWE